MVSFLNKLHLYLCSTDLEGNNTFKANCLDFSLRKDLLTELELFFLPATLTPLIAISLILRSDLLRIMP